MKVLPVHPHGYCVGVSAALSLALKAKEQYPDRKVYMLGLLVHNETAVSFLEEHGLIPLDERKAPLLDQLLSLERGDVVVFSAHGHPFAYDDLAEMKGLIVIDATCRYVKENIDAGLSSSVPVIYVGVEGHLESEAFLANCPDAVFYDVKEGKCNFIKVRGKTDAPFIICQTTLSDDEVQSAIKDIKSFFPKAERVQERCMSTSQRQAAIRALPEDVDTVIVLGSTRSNNSLKLAEIASSIGKATHLCLGLEEVKALDLSQSKRLALCSGASTSGQTFDEVLAYLRGL